LEQVVPKLALRDDAIDLWFVFLDDVRSDSLLRKYHSLLTSEEQCRAERFHFAKDRCRYLVTRVLVRTVLSRYVGLDPQAWRFRPGAYGKPEIANVLRMLDEISFNLSHTDGLVMLGVSSQIALGVDVECVTSKDAPLGLADGFFAAVEAADLYALPEHRRQERFFELWTLKEAYIKARGMGLSIPLDQFSFDLRSAHALAISFGPELDDKSRCWRFWQFKVTNHHLAAVCAANTGRVPVLNARKLVPFVLEEPIDLALHRSSCEIT
jgi:4'-phosphopantetheinyl transferase